LLNTEKFIKQLIERGFTQLCVVPCSFAKNLINASINRSDDIEYVPCASEAVTCSVAAGLAMSGSHPVVIVQSSGLTNMGSCITSLLKPYQVRFPVIVSWRTYKEGDSEIQHAHLATRLPDLINAYGYEYDILDQDSEVNAVNQLVNCESEDRILVLKKDTFSPVQLERQFKLDLSSYPQRSEYLACLNRLNSGTDTLFVGTTGNAAREMYTFMPDTENFYMAGNMGGALSLALGVAKTGRKVVVCGGDAEFVMHMGGLTTAGRYAQQLSRLIYIVFDNESNKSTGGQRTYQEHIDYLGVAKSAGLNTHDKEIRDLPTFEYVMQLLGERNGATVLHVKCAYDEEVPRPPLDVVRRRRV